MARESIPTRLGLRVLFSAGLGSRRAGAALWLAAKADPRPQARKTENVGTSRPHPDIRACLHPF